MSLATLDSFTFGGLVFKGVPASFASGGQGIFATPRLAGNLGANILSRFRLILDYSRARMYLDPVADWNAPFCKNRVGFDLMRADRFLEVRFVAPDSPAARAGWRAGDRITAIDGRPIEPAYPPTRTDWMCGPVGSTVVLTDANGARRSLVFANYF